MGSYTSHNEYFMILKCNVLLFADIQNYRWRCHCLPTFLVENVLGVLCLQESNCGRWRFMV